MTATDTINSPPAEDAASSDAADAEARTFDFRHPSTLSRDDARVLQVLQETFAHGVGATLAGAVRASIDVKIAGVEQTPHGEMIRRLANPSALVLLRLDPIAPSALLHIDPDVSFSIIELLLGGPGTGPHPTRAHTELEEVLLGDLVDRLRRTIDESFQPIATVSTSVVAQESNPTFVQIASLTDMVVRIGLDVGIDGVRGAMNLFVPVSSLRPHLDALNSDHAEAPREPGELVATQERVADHLASVDVVAVARFDPVIASSTQLLDLSVGDVLALDHQVNEPLVLEIAGVPVHDVSIGRVRRNLAVEVLGAAPTRSRRASRLSLVDRRQSPTQR